MLTRKRIREILEEQGLTPNQIDDVAAYCDIVQTELTEADVIGLANQFKTKR